MHTYTIHTLLGIIQQFAHDLIFVYYTNVRIEYLKYFEILAYEHLEPCEYWRNTPLVGIETHAHAVREYTWDIADKAPTGDVSVPLDESASHQRKYSAHVNCGRCRKILS